MTLRSLPPPDKMSFLDHLEELRQRLMRSLIALVVGFAVCLSFAQQIFHFMTEPLRKALNELEALDGEWVLPRVDEIGQRPDDGLDFTRGLLNALGILIVLAAVIVAILVVVL